MTRGSVSVEKFPLSLVHVYSVSRQELALASSGRLADISRPQGINFQLLAAIIKGKYSGHGRFYIKGSIH